MKKLTLTTWIILAGIFLYTATLWQRPLFVFEFPAWETLTEAAFKGDLLPLSRQIELYLVHNAGGNPFLFRIFTALLTLLASLTLFLSGLKCTPGSNSKAGAMIFLLTPAVFLGSTSAAPALRHGALLIGALYALFALSESKTRKGSLIWGVCAAAALTGTMTLFKAPLLYLTAAATLLIYLLFRRTTASDRSCGKCCFALCLPFLPGVFLLSGVDWSSIFTLPGRAELKTLAAFTAAGSFPWITFAPVLLRNFPAHLKEIWAAPFTLFSLILALCTLGGSFFASGVNSLALAVAALAGISVIWGALLEMEHLENGTHLLDKLLWILAIIFFLAALAVGVYALLTLYTKLIPSGCKLFTAKDAWALTALVPVVSGIWFIAGAGEKIHKERKFLAFCAGTAFALLAFHGLVPLKAVENNAPVKFFKQAVAPRLSHSAVIYCDKELFTPATAVFNKRTLKQLPSPDQWSSLKDAIKAKQSFCVLTLSRKTSNALPFPKTTLRSGRFTAVFYNIDFPEMRTRKP